MELKLHYSKIVLAGGSGYLGEVLIKHFRKRAEEIVVLSRGGEKKKKNVRYVHWDGKTCGSWAKELERADILINLAGKNVNCRYIEKNREEILNSRLDSVAVLEEAINSCKVAPSFWLQCASATIYRDARDRGMTESTGEIGEGFSEEVCKEWEAAFWKAEVPTTTKKLVRIALVLGKSDGVYPRLKSLAKLGLGGFQGNGKQMVSWIHEEDLAYITEWLCTSDAKHTTYNCSAPFPMQNAGFMRQVRSANHIAFGIPCPAWILKIGAWIIGTETELVLKSRWVLPESLIADGYVFHFPNLARALRAIEGKCTSENSNEHINIGIVEK